MPPLPISPITNQINCTPLTADFENCMMESEKKSKQRQKKFQFRSRQKKKQISVSRSPTPAFMNRRNPKNISFKTALSPIVDVSECNMSLSSNSPFHGPPITPNINNMNMDNSMDNSMNISGLSDISYIGDTNHVHVNSAYGSKLLILSPDKNQEPPELPPTTPITATLRHHSPPSSLQIKPAKRYKADH
eukprot:UN11160